MPAIGFTCTCGAIAGTVDVPSPAAGNHLVCHCPDCRAATIHLGRPDPGAGRPQGSGLASKKSRGRASKRIHSMGM